MAGLSSAQDANQSPKLVIRQSKRRSRRRWRRRRRRRRRRGRRTIAGRIEQPSGDGSATGAKSPPSLASCLFALTKPPTVAPPHCMLMVLLTPSIHPSRRCADRFVSICHPFLAGSQLTDHATPKGFDIGAVDWSEIVHSARIGPNSARVADWRLSLTRSLALPLSPPLKTQTSLPGSGVRRNNDRLKINERRL